MNTPCTPVGWAKFGILLLPVAVLLLNATAVVSMQTPATVTEERVLVALIDYVDVDPAERPFSKSHIENLLVRNDDALRHRGGPHSFGQVFVTAKVESGS